MGDAITRHIPIGDWYGVPMQLDMRRSPGDKTEWGLRIVGTPMRWEDAKTRVTLQHSGLYLVELLADGILSVAIEQEAACILVSDCLDYSPDLRKHLLAEANDWREGQGLPACLDPDKEGSLAACTERCLDWRCERTMGGEGRDEQ